ncbi:MAG: HPt (histidine-containing phosphotransfer) domain-containing protein [Planctomycetota bacterium]|jgi:HPt (histidine-containing phosphotransfer) domain-containing protein
MDAKHYSFHEGGEILDQGTIDGLIELGGDDTGLLLELIGLFLDDAGERVDQIVEAGPKSDLDTIEKMAHALKSASANIGALGFSLRCKELEANARDGQTGAVAGMVINFKGMYDELGNALIELKSSHSA